MANWSLNFALNRNAAQPLFVQLARAIEESIRSGRLRPGDPLPGSRRLADSLSLNRNTVLAGYNELLSKGWVVARPGGGTFVAPTLPVRSAANTRSHPRDPERMGFDLPRSTAIELHDAHDHPRRTLALIRAVPDVRLLPVAALARAYRHAMKREGGRLLGYGDPWGEQRLRKALAEMVSATRGIAVEAGELVITRGSQMALHLAAKALISPGDAIAVEALGNKIAWSAFRLAGAELFPVPIDSRGLRIDALEALVRKRRLRAIYVTPHHQFPTTVQMDAARRLALLELARRHRMVVLEDDYDFEFHYGTQPTLPLASADTAGVVIYCGSLSKVLAPGLRLGFVTGPRPVLQRIADIRTTLDMQGDRVLEMAVASLIEDGDLPRHVRKMRRIYERRRNAFAGALTRFLGGALSFAKPAGGMALWSDVDPGIDLDAWAARGLELGVAFAGARQFAFGGEPISAMRLGFTLHSEAELEEAAKRMAAALKAVRRSPAPT